MRNPLVHVLVICLIPVFALSQSVGINTDGSLPASSAMLDVKSNTKGLLIPRMTSVERTAIAGPSEGLLVYETSSKLFWFHNGNVWLPLSISSFISDFDGNTRVSVEKNFNENIVRFDLNGTEAMVLQKNPAGIPRLEMVNAGQNSFMGQSAGAGITLGADNTAFGFSALNLNTTGNQNTGIGSGALNKNTTNGLTAVGFNALSNNTTGDYNTATGWRSLTTNITGAGNTAVGYNALQASTSNDNTAIGRSSLASLSSGFNNTAVGSNTLPNTQATQRNTAIGFSALFANDYGNYNTAVGAGALSNNIGGTGNTGIGINTMLTNTSGSDNIAVGNGADVVLVNQIQSIAIGYNAKVGCNKCMALGGTGTNAIKVGIGTTTPTTATLVIANAPGQTGLDLSTSDAYADMRVIRNSLNATDKDLYLGFGAPAGSSVHLYSDGNETITIKGQKAGIGRTAVTNALEVEGEASKTTPGSWVGNSDGRLKKNIQQLDGGQMLEKLLDLKGVAYEWDDQKTGWTRPQGIQYGFTAQNIKEVFPALVEADKLGYLQTAYGTYDPMMVEAMRALNNKIKTLETDNNALQTELAEMKAAMQKAGLLKGE